MNGVLVWCDTSVCVCIDVSVRTSNKNSTVLFRAFTFMWCQTAHCPVIEELHWVAVAVLLFDPYFLLPTRLLCPADIKMIKISVKK